MKHALSNPKESAQLLHEGPPPSELLGDFYINLKDNGVIIDDCNGNDAENDAFLHGFVLLQNECETRTEMAIFLLFVAAYALSSLL